MKNVSARLDIEIICDCPHCGESTDVGDSIVHPYLHDDPCCTPESFIFDSRNNFEDFSETVICPECNEEFEIKGLEW